jgi:hypothetical protein
MLRFLGKIIKYLLILILVVIIGAASLTYIYRDKIKDLALEKVDNTIKGKVYFKDISVSSFKKFPHLTLTLHNACLVGIDDFAGDTLIDAKEIGITFDIYKILNGTNLEINGIHLEDPLIYARVLADGKANYNILKEDSAGSASQTQNNKFELDIDKWVINNGRIIYDDKLQKTFIEVGGLYHSGHGDFKQEISDLDITTKVSEVTFIYNGIPYFTKKNFEADLLMEMNLKEKKFIFKDHSFQLGNFKFAFTGFFKLLESGYQTDLEFIVKETSFKNLISLLPGIYQKDLEGIKTKGEFSCNGFLRGIYDAKNNRVPAFHLDLKVMDAMFKYSHLPKAVENIRFHLIADNPDGNPEHSSYDLKTFHFEIDKEPVHGSVQIKGKKEMHINADIKLKADLAEIEKIYPINGLVLKGQLNSEIKINGKYNDSLKHFPKVDAFITLENGYIKSSSTPLYMDSIHINAEMLNEDGHISDTRIKLNNMTFLLDDEPFVMSGTISDLTDYDYNLKIDGMIDLDKLTQVYPIKNTLLKGILNFDIDTEGSLSEIENKKYDLLKTHGTLEAKNVSYKTTEIAFPIHVEDAFFTFNMDKIVLDRFVGEFGKSNVTLGGHLYNYIPYLFKPDAPLKGDLKMLCDTIDMNEWFPASAPSDGTVKADTAAPVKKEPLIIPDNFHFIIDSDIKMVKFGKMNIEDLDGEIKIEDGVLTLNETGFNTMNSKFVIDGDYKVSNRIPMFDLDVDIKDLDINKAYRMFIDDKEMAPAEGVFSTKYALKGNLTPDFSIITSELKGKGKIYIDNVSVKELKLFNHIKGISKKEEFNNPQLNEVVLDTEIKDSKFLIYPCTIKVNKFITEIEGEQSFDNKMNYMVRISVPPLKKVKIPISIIGSCDKPTIKLGKGFDNTDFENLQ